MNGRRTKRTNARKRSENSECLCQGLGQALTELLRRLGPPEEARQHFDAARVEVLKGIRAILDERIQQMNRAKTKGQKIEVE